MPTGAGKTVVAAAALVGARNALAIVHTTPLLEQTKRRLGPGVRVETVQAMARRNAPIHADVVFIDECHHMLGPSWKRVMALLPRDCLVVSMTATPERADGQAMGDIFDALVAPVTYSQLLREGYLSPCESRALVGMDPAAAYLEHAWCDRRAHWRPGIMFATTIQECERAVAGMVAGGVRAATIHCALSPTERSWRVAAYSRGDLDLLASPMALAEGFDAPRAEVCVQARQCIHVGTHLQTAGRVLRPSPLSGKREALLLDLTGVVARHGSPTDDRRYSLEGTAIERVVPTAPRAASSRPAPPRSGIAPRPAPRGPAVLQQALGWLKGWLQSA